LKHPNIQKWDRNAFPLQDAVADGTLLLLQHCTSNSRRARHITAQLAVVGDYMLVMPVMLTRDLADGSSAAFCGTAAAAGSTVRNS